MNSQAIINYIVDWLLQYVDNSNQKGFIVGVSGGIDSALTSTLAAMTKKPVLVLDMPIHQPKDQISRAKEHINWLVHKFPNVKSDSVDLTPTFEIISKALAVEENWDEKKFLAQANTRSRLRMTTLYHLATIHGYLVTGTGNKVEDFGVGFYTKYGDGGVDISPIADLTKTEVFALAKELGIVLSIQSAKPTDGLWEDDRSDEDQIGATYPELEWAMSVYGKVNAAQLNSRENEVLAIYEKFNKAAQHKMNPIPVCLIPNKLKK
jgi:NAD+ synthase